MNKILVHGTAKLLEWYTLEKPVGYKKQSVKVIPTNRQGEYIQIPPQQLSLNSVDLPATS